MPARLARRRRDHRPPGACTESTVDHRGTGTPVGTERGRLADGVAREVVSPASLAWRTRTPWTLPPASSHRATDPCHSQQRLPSTTRARLQWPVGSVPSQFVIRSIRQVAWRAKQHTRLAKHQARAVHLHVHHGAARGTGDRCVRRHHRLRSGDRGRPRDLRAAGAPIGGDPARARERDVRGARSPGGRRGQDVDADHTDALPRLTGRDSRSFSTRRSGSSPSSRPVRGRDRSDRPRSC